MVTRPRQRVTVLVERGHYPKMFPRITALGMAYCFATLAVWPLRLCPLAALRWCIPGSLRSLAGFTAYRMHRQKAVSVEWGITLKRHATDRRSPNVCKIPRPRHPVNRKATP